MPASQAYDRVGFVFQGWFHAVEHQEKSVMINFWIKHPEYEPIKWKE